MGNIQYSIANETREVFFASNINGSTFARQSAKCAPINSYKIRAGGGGAPPNTRAFGRGSLRGDGVTASDSYLSCVLER